jgi:predicted transcriptional regulator
MKDRTHPIALAEQEVLATLKEGPRLFEDCSVNEEVDKERLFREMVSHGLIIQTKPLEFQTTPLGLKMLEVW